MITWFSALGVDYTVNCLDSFAQFSKIYLMLYRVDSDVHLQTHEDC